MKTTASVLIVFIFIFLSFILIEYPSLLDLQPIQSIVSFDLSSSAHVDQQITASCEGESGDNQDGHMSGRLPTLDVTSYILQNQSFYSTYSQLCSSHKRIHLQPPKNHLI